jgi:phosphate-selective porin OprO and OprP
MKPLRSPLLLCAGLVSLTSALGAELSVEDRLKLLEDRLDQTQKENAELKKQLGYSEKSPLVVVKPKGKLQNVTLGGYIQGNAEFGEAPDMRFDGINDRFLLRRARLGVQGTYAEQFDFKLEGDFGNNSISGKTGYSAQLTDMFVNWNRYDFANVKIGQFKTPFGYEQLLPDTKILTVERSLPNDMLTLSRQIGLGVSGDFLDSRLGYSVGMFNGNGVNNGFNDNNEFQYVGRVNGTPLKTKIAGQDASLGLGLNGFISNDDSLKISNFGFDSTPGGSLDNLFTGSRAGWAVDSQVKVGPFGLYAEFFQSFFDAESGNSPTTTLDDEFNSIGWYVMAAYDILPKKLQAIARFENFDPNTDIGGNSTDVWTFGLNYFLKGDDIKLSANYLIGDSNERDQEGRFLSRVQIVF